MEAVEDCWEPLNLEIDHMCRAVSKRKRAWSKPCEEVPSVLENTKLLDNGLLGNRVKTGINLSV